MLRRLIIAPALAALLMAQTAGQPAFEEAVALFQDKDYAAALDIARPFAEAGDARAMAMLGAAYQSGLGVAADLPAAVLWFERAAAKGHPGAELSLATLYLDGSLGAPDIAKAKALFAKIAGAGNVEAQHTMAVLETEAAPPDYAAAKAWFEKAAEAGHAPSQYNLGVLYAEGKGVEKNALKAAEWYAKAASQGLADAALDYGVLVFRGEGVQKDEKIGAQWLLIAARRGNVVAQNRVARLYATGRGVDEDPVEAMKWNILARKGGRADDWLDAFAEKLTPDQKSAAENLAAAFAPEGRGQKPE